MKVFPSIIILGWKKVKPLERLLNSLKRANYPVMEGIPLKIWVDGDYNTDIETITNNFEWESGPLEINFQKNHKGLFFNLLDAVNSTKNPNGFILLEDDHFVSPGFYNYALKALDFYRKDPLIGGISLYRYPYTYKSLPFYPNTAGNSVYFHQKASTRGVVFSCEQWDSFLDWNKNPNLASIENKHLIPGELRRQPNNDWEKLFNYFLISRGKYMVYPPKSFTTVFGDPGIHVKNDSEKLVFQSPLENGNPEVRFLSSTNNPPSYDAFFEPEADYIKTLNTSLEKYDFEVDMHGVKDLEKVNSPYLLTSRKGTDPVMKFGRFLKPPELNIGYDIEGKDFLLVEKKKIKNEQGKGRITLEEFSYYFPDFGIKNHLLLKIRDLFGRLKGKK